MSTDLADWDKLEASYTFLPYSSTGPSLWIIVSLHVERKRANNIIPNVHNICYRNYFVDASRANWQTNVQHLNRFFFLFPPRILCICLVDLPLKIIKTELCFTQHKEMEIFAHSIYLSKLWPLSMLIFSTILISEECKREMAYLIDQCQWARLNEFPWDLGRLSSKWVVLIHQYNRHHSVRWKNKKKQKTW